MILFIDHHPDTSVREEGGPSTDVSISLQTGQVSRDQVSLMEQLALCRLQVVDTDEWSVVQCVRGPTRALDLLQHHLVVLRTRPYGEPLAVDIPGEPDACREHDVPVGPTRIEPGDTTVRNEIDVEGHSITRMRSRNSAANSKFSDSTARRSWSRSSPMPGASPLLPDTAAIYSSPTC